MTPSSLCCVQDASYIWGRGRYSWQREKENYWNWRGGGEGGKSGHKQVRLHGPFLNSLDCVIGYPKRGRRRRRRKPQTAGGSSSASPPHNSAQDLSPSTASKESLCTPGPPIIKIAGSTVKHCYVHYTQTFVYSPLMKNTWSHPLSQWADVCQNVGKRAGTGVLMEKNEKIRLKRVYRSLVHRIKIKESDWWLFCATATPAWLQLWQRLLIHGQPMLATWPTSSSHKSVSSVLEATKQTFM